MSKLSHRSVVLALLATLLALPVGQALAQSSSGSGSSNVTGNDPQPIDDISLVLTILAVWG